MNEDRLPALIKKYLDGTCSLEERILIEEWYEAQDEGNASFYDNNEKLISESKVRSLVKIQAEISSNKIHHSQPASTKAFISRPLLSKMAIAASVLICCTLGIYFYLNKGKYADLKYAVITASEGKVVHLILNDHTNVWLNAGSQIKYPKTFEQGRRDVYIDGEAYFDVAHDTSRPFRVHTSKLTTTVLGTAFCVTAYKNSLSQSVSVSRGKVQVENDQKVLGLLTYNKRIDYDVRSKAGLISDDLKAASISWKEGKLEFENQQMQDIVDRLGRWYGYTFIFKNPALKTCRYTASFRNDISMDDLLKIIKTISKVDYKIDAVGKTVSLNGTGCPD